MKSVAHEIGRAITAVVLLLVQSLPGQAGELSGRVELSFESATAPSDSATALFGGPDHDAFLGDLRLRWSHDWGDVSVEIHYKLSNRSGPGVGISEGLAALSPAPPPANFLDLSRTTTNGSDQTTEHRIDRLSLTYTTPNIVVRVGRQALSWGAGTVFHPMDLVAPFSPATRDTEFKPGVDMAYAQFLLSDASDVEIIAVPRRTVSGDPATLDASTFGLRYRTTIGDTGAEFILARDHGDATAGLGLSGDLGGASWNVEVVPTRLSTGEIRTSGLANISAGLPVLGRSALVFGEYFHNGFGVAGTPAALSTLPADLADRLQRGQLFSVSQDYLAMGLTVAWTPLLTLSGGAILNLNDNSSMTTIEANWSLSDNSNLIVGAIIPTGDAGSEFGGIPVSPGNPIYARPENTVYIRYRQYF